MTERAEPDVTVTPSPISPANNRLTCTSQPQSAPNRRNTSPARDNASRTAPLRISVALWKTAVRDSCRVRRQRRSRAAATTRSGEMPIHAITRASAKAPETWRNSTASAQISTSKHASPPSRTQGSATCQRLVSGTLKYTFSINSSAHTATARRTMTPRDHRDTCPAAGCQSSHPAAAASGTAARPISANARPAAFPFGGT